MCKHCHNGTATGRRHFLLGASSALAAAGVLGLFPPRRGAEAAAQGSGGPVTLPQPSSAAALQQALPAPLPIPGGEDVGPPVGIVHQFVPGPQGLGLDVEPSLITNFKGFTAFTIVEGQAEGSDGKTYDVRSDLRVMAGEYVAEDGSHHRGTFAFF
jgi:hypothetical protein